MKKVQLNRYHTAMRVQHYLHEQADLYAENAPMVATAELLDAKIAELETQLVLQTEDSKGWTMNKRFVRKDLENQAFVLSSAICIFALITENQQLYRGCYYTKSDLLHFRDVDFIYNCEKLLNNLTEHAEELLPYSVTPEMIAEFTLAIAKFKEIVEAPRDAISQKAKATAAVQRLLVEIMDVIRLRLDKVMVSMIAPQPEFVKLYKLLKRIKKAPHHKRALTVVVKDFETGKPLAQAAIETANKIKRKTGVKGQSYVAHLSEGCYKLGVSLLGYDSQSLEYTVMEHRATKVEVLLQKTIVGSVPELVEGITGGFVDVKMPSFVEVMASLGKESNIP